MSIVWDPIKLHPNHSVENVITLVLHPYEVLYHVIELWSQPPLHWWESEFPDSLPSSITFPILLSNISLGTTLLVSGSSFPSSRVPLRSPYLDSFITRIGVSKRRETRRGESIRRWLKGIQPGGSLVFRSLELLRQTGHSEGLICLPTFPSATYVSLIFFTEVIMLGPSRNVYLVNIPNSSSVLFTHPYYGPESGNLKDGSRQKTYLNGSLSSYCPFTELFSDKIQREIISHSRVFLLGPSANLQF